MLCRKPHLIRHSFVQSSNYKSIKDYIGLGWTVTTDFGKEVLSHTGSIDGYTGIIGFNPSMQIGLVILCGCDHSDFSSQEMIDLAIHFLLLQRPEIWDSRRLINEK